MTGLLLCLAPLAGHAQTCTSVGSAGLAFGAYDPFAGDRDAVGHVRYECSVAPRIQLGAGSGTFSRRELRSGGSALGYNLFTDSARMNVWGDGAAGTSTVTGSADGSPVSIPVYGRIFRNQPVPPGTYADTIVVTLLF